MPTEQVIIEFIPDLTQLASVEERLTALGLIDQKSATIFKATNDQLKARQGITENITESNSKQESIIGKLTASLKTLSGESKKAVQNLLTLSTDELSKGFDQAGVSVDEYIEALSKAGGATNLVAQSSVKLKTQLRSMTEELARLKLAGQDNTEQYKKLSAEAAHLSDTIGDTNAEVKRLASDTSTFDGLIAGAQGLTGGFAAAQGAVALFGGSSDELQETLVKVSASMAVLQGLQQISTLTQNESALSLLAINLQRKITNAQLAIENGLQSRSAVVRVAATVAQKALNVAMAANPIGIVITALVTVIGLFTLYANSARKAAEQQGKLNAALESTGDQFNAELEGIKDANKKRISELEIAGAKQSEIQKQNLKNEVLLNDARARQLQENDKAIAAIGAAHDQDTLDKLNELRSKQESIRRDMDETNIDNQIKNNERLKQIRLEDLQDAVSNQQAILDTVLANGGKNSRKDFAAQKQLLEAEAALEVQSAGDNAAKIYAINAKLKEDLHQLGIASREQEQKDVLAALDTELIKRQNQSRAINERESQSEIDIKKKIILTTAKFESEQEGLSQKQRTEIRVKALQETAQLQRDFSKQSVEDNLQDFISANNAELAQLNISEKDKLNLKIDNILAAAEIEVAQNQGLTAKIKEINAKRDADIKATRLQSIQDTLAYELQLTAVNNAEQERIIANALAAQDQLRNAPNNQIRKRLEAELGIQKLNIQDQNALIDQQTQFKLDSLNTEKQALRDSYKQGLIAQKDYTLQYAKLNDEEVQVVREGENKKTDLRKKSIEEQKALNLQLASQLNDIASQVGNLLFDNFQASLDKQAQAIDVQKKKIEDLKEAGAISEKEATDRLRQVAREEAKLKTKQAQKDKEAAIFNAVINTAQAVIKAYSTVGPIAGPIMAAIVGAIGLAQVAIIAARPIPKFAKGKKDRYQGLGQVGEAGSELIESKGQMYITKKPTIMWLGAKDKVYNPKETKAILNREMPTVHNKVMINGNKENGNKAEPLDYEKLGRSIGKYTSTTMNIDGYKAFIKEQQSFTTYLNNRRGY